LHQRLPTNADLGESQSVELFSNPESITFLTNNGNGFYGKVKVTMAGEDVVYRCMDCLANSPSTILGQIYVDTDMNGPVNEPETANCKQTCTYKGVPSCLTFNKTKSGKTCQKWTSQDPHNHDNVIGDHNYCRNPDSEEGPWCYTTDPNSRWEYCDCGMLLDLKPFKVKAA